MGIAASLQGGGGRRGPCAALYAPGLDFIAAFMGCVYAGVVAVPTYPPNPAQLDRTLPRLRAIARDAGARFVLMTGLIASSRRPSGRRRPSSRAPLIATDALEPGAASAWRAPDISGETLAFLQYTSGSTGHPSGVMVSHANVIANEQRHPRRLRARRGLVGRGVAAALPRHGAHRERAAADLRRLSVTHMSPLAFLERPLRWLKAISISAPRRAAGRTSRTTSARARPPARIWRRSTSARGRWRSTARSRSAPRRSTGSRRRSRPAASPPGGILPVLRARGGDAVRLRGPPRRAAPPA